MRILLTSHAFPPHSNAGVERFVDALAAGLAAAGNEVSIVHGLQDPSRAQGAVVEGQRGDVRTFALIENYPYRPLGEQLQEQAGLRAFRSIAEKVEPQIVHMHHLKNLGLGLAEAAQGVGAKTLLHLHDYWLWCPSGGQLFQHGQARCTTMPATSTCAACVGRHGDRRGRLEQLGFGAARTLGSLGIDPTLPGRAYLRLPHKLRGLLKQANRPGAGAGLNGRGARSQDVATRREDVKRLLLRVDRVVAPSNHMASRARSFGCREVEVLENAVADVRPVAMKRSPWQGGALRLLFVGTVVPHKGLDLAASAVAGTQGVQLVVAGPTPDVAYREICAAAGAGKVRFLGLCSAGEVASLMQQADLLLIPSQWEENAPLTILEARRAGLPMIGSRMGGIPELLQDGMDGILVDEGDLEGWSRVLGELSHNPDRLQALRQTIRQPPPHAQLVDRVETLYRGLLA